MDLEKSWLSTDPADRMAAEAAVRSNIKSAKTIMWVDSPAAACAVGVQHHAWMEAGARQYEVRESRGDWRMEVSTFSSVGIAMPSSFAPGMTTIWPELRRESHGQTPKRAEPAYWPKNFPLPPSTPLPIREQRGRKSDDPPIRTNIRGLVSGLSALSIGASLDMDTRVMAVTEHCHGGLFYNDACVLIERPSFLSVDDRKRLHCDHGPAIIYRDGFCAWAMHGVRMDRRLIEEPASITPDDIDAQGNTEVRRTLMDRFGANRYFKEGGAEIVHQDHTGKLWRKRSPWAHRRRMQMVEVINSTPEPDGTFKTYWLRVSPDCETAAEAVAWTFNKSATEYAPQLET